MRWRGRLRPHTPLFLLLIAYTAVVLLTFRDYGVTFDEKWNADYGTRILSWYGSGMTDRERLERPILRMPGDDPNLENMSYYGGFFDVVAEVLARRLPFGRFEGRHLVNALFGVAGACFAYLLGLSLAGRLAGFLAALFLMLTPFYFGHAFNNPKDIPFAVLYLASLCCIVRLGRSLPRPRWRLVAVTGAAIGLTMAVRFPGVLLLGYVCVAFLGWTVARPRGEIIAATKPFVSRFAACSAIAFIVMLPWWPAAFYSPLTHPLRTLRALGAYPWNFVVRFEGRDIRATELPWYYVEKHALLTLPEFVLLGIVLGIGIVLARVMAGRPPPSRQAVAGFGIVGFAIVFPLVYADITGATVYDGLRHFLFVFPPLIVLSAAGIAAALQAGRSIQIPTGAVAAVAVAMTVVEMVRLHPHQYVYFNRVVAGGLSRAHENYETDYWGNAFKEAAEWVVARYPGTADRPVRVATCSSRTSTAYFMPEATHRVVGFRAEPDIFLGSRRFGCWNALDGPIVHAVERRGVRLVVIKEVGPHVATRR